MADAKKCDICGAFYSPYNVRKDPNNTSGLRFLNLDIGGRYYSNRIYDLCPSCMQAIKTRIKELQFCSNQKPIFKEE